MRALGDDNDKDEFPAFWAEADAERREIAMLSVDIDRRIEELREIQASLWSVHNPLVLPEDRKSLTADRRKARRVIKRQSTKLQKLMPDLKVA